MEGPKQIYVPKSHLSAQITKGDDSHIKYVRADLAELTWQDVRILCDSFMNVGLRSDLPARSKDFYEEVLRVYRECKKKKDNVEK